MVQILITWLLFALICLFLGVQFEKLLRRFFPEMESVSLWLLLWSGMAVLYLQLSLFTFFQPLHTAGKIILWFLLSLWVFIDRKVIRILSGRISAAVMLFHPLSWLIFFLTAFIGLLKSAGMPEIFDEGAYHLPLIRMWEQQGVVPGFANLNAHYGLHSGWHILSAFSNLSFLPGFENEMCLNGFLAALLGLFSASRLGSLLKGNNTGIAGAAAIFLPIFLFRNLLSSASTDVPAIIGAWFFFLLWMEQTDKPVHSQVFLFLLPVFLTVLKASSAGLLLASAGFLFVLIKSRRTSVLIVMALYGLLFGFWMLQNWLLSGYVFFPLEFSALGNPDWLVPAESIRKKFYPEQFGAFAPPASYSLAWLSSWFAAHNADSKLIIMLAAGFFLAAPLLSIFYPELRRRTLAGIYLMLLLLTGIWFFTVTEPRYGFGALVMAALFIPAYFLRLLAVKAPLVRFIPLLVLPLMFLNSRKTLRELQVQPFGNIILKPAPVPLLAFRSLKCGNFSASSPQKYLSPVPDDKPVFCWDCPFPCFPLEGIQDSALVFENKMAWFTSYSFRKNSVSHKTQSP